MENPIVVKLCHAFVKREQALGMKKGRGRDDAAMHFFCGAANVLAGEEQRAVAAFIEFGLQYQGYSCIAKTVEDVPLEVVTTTNKPCGCPGDLAPAVHLATCTGGSR